MKEFRWPQVFIWWISNIEDMLQKGGEGDSQMEVWEGWSFGEYILWRPASPVGDRALRHEFGLVSDFSDIQLALQNAGAERESDVRLISGLLDETMHSSVQQTFIELSWKGSCKWECHPTSYIRKAEDPMAHEIHIFSTLMAVVQSGKNKEERNQKHHGDHIWKVDQSSSSRLAGMNVAWWVKTRDSEAARTGIPGWLPWLHCTAKFTQMGERGWNLPCHP